MRAAAALLVLLAACGTSADQPRHIVVAAGPTTTRPHTTIPNITTTVPRPTTTKPSRSHRRQVTLPTVPAYRPVGPCGGWESLVGKHFPAEQVGTACRVLMCESGGNPAARNPRSSATGLFQILKGPVDAEANVALAASMWARRGWQPWNASRGCWR
jgi:hypothetical protein